MEGSNTLQLNHACMTKAVQMYLDDLFDEGRSPKVQSISEDKGDHSFEVKVTGPEGEED